ncbi:putative transcriptional regulator [Leadbettera azotonutricia ZAS-9]|uniref:Putative transcriptional regulator n=1 Tax=Leadbettera azotonutricia (strain ATCC BAA-888 / DSM 13862 / ZAS-9) TaxID=545695 RepID=F5YD49_LEAAZ|nr:putative transcriptional regulator [Leadbettera azotonutricia ZAS-9]
MPPGSRIPSENELCRLHGISIITVRKALSDLVHENRVVRIKGKGSFVASQEAKGPAQIKQESVGIVSLVVMYYRQLDSPIISLIKGAQGHFSSDGYSMILECSNKNAKTEAEIIDKCIRNKVDGVLIYSADPAANEEKLVELEAKGIPLVMLDRWFENAPCTLVASYHSDGIYQATRHLIQYGHRRIAFIGPQQVISETDESEPRSCVFEERLKGYKAALKYGGMDFNESLCVVGGELQFQTLDDLIEKKGVTALVCINDRTGIEVLAYLKRRNIRVPEDISVTGFDDNQNAKQENLTTIRQRFQELGEIGAQKLLERIRGDTGKSQTVLPVELVVRGSSGVVNNQFRMRG